MRVCVAAMCKDAQMIASKQHNKHTRTHMQPIRCLRNACAKRSRPLTAALEAGRQGQRQFMSVESWRRRRRRQTLVVVACSRWRLAQQEWAGSSRPRSRRKRSRKVPRTCPGSSPRTPTAAAELLRRRCCRCCPPHSQLLVRPGLQLPFVACRAPVWHVSPAPIACAPPLTVSGAAAVWHRGRCW